MVVELGAVTVRNVYRLRVFMNTVLQEILGPNRILVKIEEFHDLYSMSNIKGQSVQGRYDGWSVWLAWKRKETQTEFWWKT
jgi:hypothetical protein